MKQELEYCNTHCCPLPTSTVLPARLLDLGASDTNENVRLIRTSDAFHEKPLRYAALSYCWGTREEAEQQLKTTRSNLEQHLDSIPLAAMTPVAEDAIKTTRSLSIRYLWIDAMCIVQDDADDWARESQKMGTIYTNAYVTLCTAAISSCLERFLRRSPAIKIGFQSRLRPDIHGYYNLRYQAVSEARYSLRWLQLDPLFLDLYRGGEWHRRAWTLQENQLSTRRLYFGYSHIHLVCSTRELTEPGLQTKLGFSIHTTLRQDIQEYRQNQDLGTLYDSWARQVQHYVQRRITYEQDMFPAISGLAKVIDSEINDKYIAGLWKGDLLSGLLWKNPYPARSWDDLLSQCSSWSTDTYIGPSWSWCNQNEISFVSLGTYRGEHAFRSECKSLRTWSTPESALNLFGKITASELHIEGKLLKPDANWKLSKLDRFDPYDPVEYYGGIAMCMLDFAVPNEVNEICLNDVFILLLASTKGFQTRPDHQNIGEDNSLVGTSDIALNSTSAAGEEVNQIDDKILVYPDAHGRRKSRTAWGLILQPIIDTDKFFRVGTFWSSPKHGGLDFFDQLPFTFTKIV